MNTIVLFDPGIRSLNKGDEIIMKSAESELTRRNLLQGSYVIHAATHAPVVTWYQNTKRNPHMKVYDEAKYKFICGSNLIWKNMLKPRPVFNVDITNCRPYKSSILLGAGIGLAKSQTNLYTKELYKKILSKKYVHSVRDEKTAEFLRCLGYQAIDTGCPTMWMFTPEFCHNIPSRKSKNVIFTLTDYGRAPEYDQKLINILLQHYEKVYFWIQGAFDKEYFDTFENTEKIQAIEPSLEAYSRILLQENIEYVGTRLHAGMYAMQHKRRAIILAIDDRVKSMRESYAFHTLEREKIDLLPKMIYSELNTDVHLKQENIEMWFSQFENGE